MSTNEIAWFAGLIGLGLTAGCISAIVAAKKARSLGSAVFRALLVAVTVPLAYCFVAGLFEWPREEGFTVSAAIWAGIAFTSLYGFGMSLVSGAASLLFSTAFYSIFKWCNRVSNK